MSNSKNSIGFIKHYDYRIPNTYKDFVEQARSCNQCREPTVVEYNLRTHKVETYELDPYPEQRINHRHPADVVTRTSVITAIAVEKRYLHEKGPGDYDPVSRRVIN